MASVHFPNDQFEDNPGVPENWPYIMSATDDYLEGVNHYAYERFRGRVDPKDVLTPRLKVTKLGKAAITSIIYSLCDATTFLESSAAHPLIGSMSWDDCDQWMINDLYQSALNTGYWSRAFWQTGSAIALASSTSKTKVDEAIRCGAWLQANGYNKNFGDDNSDYKMPEALADMEQSFDSLASSLERPGFEPATTRANPANGIPPSHAEIIELIATLPNQSYQVGAFLLYETGMRADELVNNTNIPPSWSGRGGRRPNVGFLPDLNAFLPIGSARLEECKWAILGKNDKVRHVSASPKTLRALWKLSETYRAKVLRETKSSKPRARFQLFVNRDGGAASYHNFYSAFRIANIALDRSFRITQHILRHAHACAYLEAGLTSEMRAVGVDIANATFEQFMSLGEGVLVALKQDLGHEFFETTQRYLVLLAHGKIGLRYQLAFNRKLDDLGGIDAILDLET